MSELIDKAKRIIKENLYFTLGTVGADNKPWVSPLFYCFDEELNFYWVSPKDSFHSKNIKENGRVSLVIFNSQAPIWTGVGLYMTGTAEELEDKIEIEKCLNLEFTRLGESVPSYDKYLGDNTYRAYRAKISNIWITADIKNEKGETVDHRSEINKKELI